MAVHQAPLFMGFSRQEYWSGLPFPSPMHACMLSHFSHVRLCATLWTASHKAPLFMGFSRQEYWSGLPFPSPRQVTGSLCPELTLQAYLYSKQHRKIDIVFLSGANGRHTYCPSSCPWFRLLSWRFLSYKTTHYVCRYHLRILLLAFGIGAQEIAANANTLASAFAMNNKIFVSDPGVPCLLPASMKLWQIILLACK